MEKVGITTGKDTSSSVFCLYELTASKDLRFSPHCWRSRAVLLFKQIPFETKPVKFTELAHFLDGEADYHMVPVVRYTAHGGSELWCDSWRIACELERLVPQRKIFPSEDIRAACYAFHTFAIPDLLGIIFRFICPSIFDRALPEDKEYFRAKVKRQTGSDIEELRATSTVQQARYEMKLSQLEQIFTKSAFVFGAHCCYADLMLFAALQWVVLIDGEQVAFGSERFTATRKWFEGIRNELRC